MFHLDVGQRLDIVACRGTQCLTATTTTATTAATARMIINHPMSEPAPPVKVPAGASTPGSWSTVPPKRSATQSPMRSMIDFGYWNSEPDISILDVGPAVAEDHVSPTVFRRSSMSRPSLRHRSST